MEKQVKITIPDFLTIKQYKELSSLEHLEDFAKYIRTISIISKIDEKEVRTWSPMDIANIYSDILKAMDIQSEFYPIIEHNEIQYGFAYLEKLTIGEYIDLEKLIEKPHDNLEEIIAMFYRPITEHKFKSLKFRFKHNVRLATKKLDNIFKYYTLEKYDSDERTVRAKEFEDFPVALALGALAFFLQTANTLLVSMTPYSNQKSRLTKMKAIEESLKVLVNIGGGLRRFIHYPNQAFSTSQEKVVSLT